MRIVIIALTFISFSALACPQLSGSYPNCRSVTNNNDVDYDIVVSQRIVNSAVEYTVSATDSETHERSTYSILADGITRNEQIVDSDWGITFDISTNAKCMGDSLVVSTTTNLNGELYGNTISRIIKVGNEIYQETKGEMMGQSINDLVICQ